VSIAERSVLDELRQLVKVRKSHLKQTSPADAEPSEIDPKRKFPRMGDPVG
jgi:hypothetical protein